ncbi:MAG: hypothetical protein LBC04_02020 [Holosporaceae bacterium]|nr:hypothetical protein [Holosporaceae bacterium]
MKRKIRSLKLKLDSLLNVRTYYHNDIVSCFLSLAVLPKHDNCLVVLLTTMAIVTIVERVINKNCGYLCG